jgi:hypothetical protein
MTLNAFIFGINLLKLDKKITKTLKNKHYLRINVDI